MTTRKRKPKPAESIAKIYGIPVETAQSIVDRSREDYFSRPEVIEKTERIQRELDEAKAALRESMGGGALYRLALFAAKAIGWILVRLPWNRPRLR